MEPEKARLAVLAAYRGMSFTEVREHAGALALALAAVDHVYGDTVKQATRVIDLANTLMEHLQIIGIASDRIGAAFLEGRISDVQKIAADLNELLDVHREFVPLPQLPPYRSALDVYPEIYTPKGATT